MNIAPLTALCEEWRAEAATFRHRGQDATARLMEAVAEDLEGRLGQWQAETLDLEEAAAESGFSYTALQHRLSEGTLPNAGEKGSPRIRRCDLPVKGGKMRPRLAGGGPDLAGRVLGRRMGG